MSPSCPPDYSCWMEWSVKPIVYGVTDWTLVALIAAIALVLIVALIGLTKAELKP